MFLHIPEYKILHVGKNDSYKDDYILDNTGDNISYKNQFYCELTGLYWIWKNGEENDSDIVGLVHYRRFFTTKFYAMLFNYFGIRPHILSIEVIKKDLRVYDIILPQKKHSFRSVRWLYVFFHNQKDLELVREALVRTHPAYVNTFDSELMSHSYYYANMMICRKTILNQYAEWLFKLFDDLEQYIDLSKYNNEYQARVYGFLSERLLQVWVKYNKLEVRERSIINLEEREIPIFHSMKDRLKRLFSLSK